MDGATESEKKMIQGEEPTEFYWILQRNHRRWGQAGLSKMVIPGGPYQEELQGYIHKRHRPDWSVLRTNKTRRANHSSEKLRYGKRGDCLDYTVCWKEICGQGKAFKKWLLWNSLAAQCLGFCAFTAEAWVWSLVGELRFFKPPCAAKR